MPNGILCSPMQQVHVVMQDTPHAAHMAAVQAIQLHAFVMRIAMCALIAVVTCWKFAMKVNIE